MSISKSFLFISFFVMICLAGIGCGKLWGSLHLASTDPCASSPLGLYSRTVLADHPIGYWRLGEKCKATVAVDLSGNKRNGAYSGNYTLGLQGALANDPDPAVGFDGDSASIDIPGTGLMPTSVSVEAWVNPASFEALLTPIVFKLINGYALSFLSDGSLFWCVFNGGASGGVASLAPVSLNKWIHAVGTYNGTTTTLYLNGVFQGSTGPHIMTPDTDDVTIGNWIPGWSIYGQIDEVSIYDYPLSAAQAANHYHAAGF